MNRRTYKIIAIIQVVVSAIMLITCFMLWTLTHISSMDAFRLHLNWYYINIFAAIPIGIILITSIILLVIMNKKK